jgi:hypothetical protein
LYQLQEDYRMPLTSVLPSPAGAILARVIRPEESDLPPAAAEAFLRFAFSQRDRGRMHELAAKNQEGVLTDVDRQELDSYLQVGMILDLLQAKARLTLSQAAKRPPSHG